MNFSYEVFRRDYRVFFIPITFIPYRGYPGGRSLWRNKMGEGGVILFKALYGV
jgi:hypothetical protein